MTNIKCTLILSSNFKKQYKKIAKQGKNLDKIDEVIDKLARFEILDPKYKDHNLINDKYYKNCRECHIEPDWLLIYQYENNKLNLLLIATGSHSEIFK
jgi:mRNA interferase YafQ